MSALGVAGRDRGGHAADGRRGARGLLEAFVVEVLNGGSAEAVGRLFSPAYRDHEPFFGLPPGPGGVLRLARLLSAPGVDLCFVLEEAAVDGPLVAGRLFGEGTVDGPFAALVAPPGRAGGSLGGPVHLVVSTVSLFRVSGGRFASRWGPVSVERAVLP